MFHVEPLEQPSKLLLAQRDDRPLEMEWPFEPLLLEPLLPKTEPAPLPIEDLDLIAALVDEAIQVRAEGIELQRHLDQHRQGIYATPKINRLAAQIDRDITARRRRYGFRRSCALLPTNSHCPALVTTRYVVTIADQKASRQMRLIFRLRLI